MVLERKPNIEVHFGQEVDVGGWHNAIWYVWDKIVNYRRYMPDYTAQKCLFVLQIITFFIYPMIGIISYKTDMHKWLWIPIMIVCIYYVYFDFYRFWIYKKWHYHGYIIMHFVFLALDNGLCVNYSSMIEHCR